MKTIQNAKKTGQLWGASYIFSYIAKNLIIELKNKGLAEKFILPYVDDEILKPDNKSKRGVGFPDRLIFQANDNAFERLDQIINEVLDNIADKITETLEIQNYETESKDAKDYIHNYFQVYYVEVELEENSNHIIEISPYLEQLELYEAIIPCETRNYIMEFLKNTNVKNSFLAEDTFKDSTYKIKSLPEIASVEVLKLEKYHDIENHLKCKGIDRNDEDYYEKFYKFLGDDAKKFYKYIAIVQADGDNIGKIVERLSKGNFDDFSKSLLKFSLEAGELVAQYGGELIYAGGDDLLFFAPIFNKFSSAASERGKIANIFDLLDGLSGIFDGYFIKFKNEIEKTSKAVEKLPEPSLSFGLTISYNKFPLYEALENSVKLLFGQAKKFKLGGQQKNAIAFNLIKHSGQKTGSIVAKNSESYKYFKEILKKIYQIDHEKVGEDDAKVETNFLNSVIYHLMKDKSLLREILQMEDQDTRLWKQSLDNYFENKFKKHEKYVEILDDINNLIASTYQDYKAEMDKLTEKNEDKKKRLDELFEQLFNQIHSFLKFIKFLNEEGNES